MTESVSTPPAIPSDPEVPRGALTALRTVVRTVPMRVLVDPVRSGRLRDQGWPVGLRMVVGVAVAAYLVGLIVVAVSGPLRAGSTLTVPAPATITVPRAWLWLVLLVVLVALALFQTAALHTSWWLRLVALATSIVVMGQWGLRSVDPSGGLVESILTVITIVVLVVFVIMRWRRPFAWWEFLVVWALLTAPVVLGIVVLNRTSGPLGYDFVPTYLLATVTLLGPVAIPAAILAGLSVAEITVSATLWTTRVGGEVAKERTAYVVLAVLLLARLVQAAWQLSTGDALADPANTFIVWLLICGVFVALWMLMVRLARNSSPRVSELPERMAALGLPLGVAVVASAYLSVIVVTVFTIVEQLAPTVVGARSAAWQNYLVSSDGPAVSRVLIGVALVLLASSRARRGNLNDALLLCTVAVLLWARSARPLTNGWLDTGAGFDMLNLLATAVLMLVTCVLAARRRLTSTRAIWLSAAVVLTFLFGYRDFISDPLGGLLGFSGAALVLFGLTWDLLTDSAIANSDTRRYPKPSRVLLVLANSVLAIGILAFTSLVRDPSATIDLGAFAQLGDEILGTALIACTFFAILLAVPSREPAE